MIKILFLTILTLALSGCQVEVIYRPQRTAVVRQYYLPVDKSVRSGISYVDLSEKVDMWLSASTQSERDKIENLFFPIYKLRINGDNILLKNIGGVDFLSISTRGAGFNSDGAHWTYAMIDDTLDIKRLASQQWHLTTVNGGGTGNKYDLKFTKTASDNQYKVVGSGISTLMGDKIDDKNEEIIYTVDSDLIVRYRKLSNTIFDIYTVELVKGEISYKSNYMSEKAKVIYRENDVYSITYRGFTENWPNIL